MLVGLSRVKETGADQSYLAFKFNFLFICVWSVPFREASLALAVLNENE